MLMVELDIESKNCKAIIEYNRWHEAIKEDIGSI